MFDRLLEQKCAVVLALAALKYFELLTDPEWNTFEKIISILRIFLVITEEISSEKNVNLSKIIAIKNS